MGRTHHIIIAAALITWLLCSVNYAAVTVIGQPKFTNNSTYTSGIDARFKLFTSTDRMTAARMSQESAARQNIDTRFKLFTSIDRVTAARMTQESTARQAHIQSIVPAGGHPAAGNNRQVQYNNNGSFAGAAQSRYSSGSHIFQAADRYSQTVLHKNSSGAITAYMLGGQGILVLGSPYTNAFTISNFSSYYSNYDWPAADLLEIEGLITHSVDTQTLIKGSTVVFRGFTSFNYATALRFIARWVPHPPVNVRMVVTNQVRDINGNYMYSNYSSEFVKYSSL